MQESTLSIQPFCPVCKSAVTTAALHQYSVDDAASHFCPRSRDPDRFSRLRAEVRRLWQADTSEVYVCERCGFGFGWPHVGGDEAYYSILHEQAGYPADRWEYRLTIKRLRERYPAGGRILDVGTGDGAFLKKLPRSWRKSATEGSATTRKRLRENGIECFGSTADAIAESPRVFRVVTMFQVLEHVAAFRSLLADCFTLLEPGGCIVISVPLAAAMFAQERLTGCQDMTPNHINKWSPEALAMALRQTGFTPEAPTMEPVGFGAAVYRAGLMTRAQAARMPGSLAALAYGIRWRPLRMGALALISALHLARSLPRLPRFMSGSSFLIIGTKPVAAT